MIRITKIEYDKLSRINPKYVTRTKKGYWKWR